MYFLSGVLNEYDAYPIKYPNSVPICSSYDPNWLDSPRSSLKTLYFNIPIAFHFIQWCYYNLKIIHVMIYVIFMQNYLNKTRSAENINVQLAYYR